MKRNWGIIKDESSYKEALARIREIFHAEEGTAEYDELELLSILVDEYESKNVDIEQSDPIDNIHFIMEQRDLRQTDLVGILGDKTNVSKVLSRKRPLTLEMIRRFARKFHISADLLLEEYRLVS
jgi:HTH-type transcriptional regulator/antitoxin HigA